MSKKYVDESKICTFRVAKKERSNGVGTRLMRQSLNWLESSHSVITINEEKVSQYKPLLAKFDFQRINILSGLYIPKQKEVIYRR